MGQASGALSLAGVCSSVLGPVLGGVIATHTTWRVGPNFISLNSMLTEIVGILDQRSMRRIHHYIRLSRLPQLDREIHLI